MICNFAPRVRGKLEKTEISRALKNYGIGAVVKIHYVVTFYVSEIMSITWLRNRVKSTIEIM